MSQGDGQRIPRVAAFFFGFDFSDRLA